MKANIDNHHKVAHGSDPVYNKTISNTEGFAGTLYSIQDKI